MFVCVWCVCVVFVVYVCVCVCVWCVCVCVVCVCVVCVCGVFACAQSCLTLCNPMDCTHQPLLSMGFSRQEYWSWLLFSSPRDLPDPGIKLQSPALQADSLLSEPLVFINYHFYPLILFLPFKLSPKQQKLH